MSNPLREAYANRALYGEAADVPGFADLTTAQKRLVNAILDHGEREGRAPSYRELAAVLGLSLAGIAEMVGRLERKGVLTRERHGSRSIRVKGCCPHCGRPMPDGPAARSS